MVLPSVQTTHEFYCGLWVRLCLYERGLQFPTYLLIDCCSVQLVYKKNWFQEAASKLVKEKDISLSR